VGFAADVAALALAPLLTQSERRTYLLLDDEWSGLAPFLARRAGLESGLMLVQYTAAALVSECKTLSHPASADSIPTSAGMEDHVSMAPWAARKLSLVIENARRVVACELLVAAAALDARRPLTAGRGTEAVHAAVRRLVALYESDRSPSADLESLARWIGEDGVRTAVTDAGVAWPRLFSPATAPEEGVRS